MNQNIIHFGSYQIYLNKRIGLGSHSITYLCSNSQQLQMQLVAKIYKNQNISLLDVEKLKDIRHIHLVQIYEIFQHDKDIIIIMEKCYSSLRQHIQSQRTFEQTELQQYLKQILIALAVLQAQGLELKNIKPTNVLFDENDQIKISNYGLQTLYHLNDTNPYAAPEFFFCKQQTEAKIIYAVLKHQSQLGLMLYHLLFHELPFKLRCNGDVLQFIQKLKYKKLEIPPSQNYETITQLITQMVKYESSERITREKLHSILEIHQCKRSNKRIMSIQPIAAKADSYND